MIKNNNCFKMYFSLYYSLDHPWHGTHILGGMWGFYSARNRNLANQIYAKFTDKQITARYNAGMKSPKGGDQQFLSEHVYSILQTNSVMHDSYLCAAYGGSPFPTRRVGDCYIGGVTVCNASATFYECPQNCRPPNNKDWVTC